MVAPKRKSAESLPEHPKKKSKPAEGGTGPSKALLRPQAEPEFIRGGADTLSPIERKKIAAKAAQDILFEDHAASRAPAAGGSDAEDPDSIAPRPRPDKPKRRRREDKSKAEKTDEDWMSNRIICEGLTTRKLVPGAKVLGQIIEIRKSELVLSLPNNLTGYVAINAISDGVTSRLEASAESDGQDEHVEEREAKEVVLISMFRTGQWLRAAVISTSDQSDSETVRKRRIELSINPRLANHGLHESDITVNAAIQAEILSIEDHGIIVGLGLEGSTVRGFVSAKDTSNHDQHALQPGAVVLGLVTSIGSNGKVVKLSFDHRKIGDVENGSFLKSAPGIGVLLPGTAVDFIVSDITAAGVVGKVLGLVDIMADIVHSGAWQREVDLNERYNVASRIRGRLLWASEVHDKLQIGVSLLPHILSLTPANPSIAKDNKIGDIVDDARIASVQPKFGLFMDIGSGSTSAFVHISRVADDKVETLSESAGPYMIDTLHRCRLTGYNCVDGLYLAAMNPKTLALPFLRMEDLNEGQIVQGSIERLTESMGVVSGALVKLTDTVSGFVPALHLSDVVLSHPERKFRPGVSVTARVLSITPETRALRLTLKKTLVNSDAPIWRVYEELTVGASAPGTIVKFVPSGAVVQFFGSLKGLLPLSQMSESYITDPQQHFRLGQVVNVRILTINPSEDRLILTCRETESYGPEQQEAIQNTQTGGYVDGKVIEKTRSEVILETFPAKITGILPIEHLVDGSETSVLEAAKRLHIGQKITHLMVLRKDYDKGRLEVTKKPSLLKAKAGRLPARFQDLSVGALVDGYVSNVTEAGIFVSFLGDLNALLPKRNLEVDARERPNFGTRKNQSISAYVSNLDHQQQRIVLSTRKPTTGSLKDGTRLLANPVDGITTSLSEFTVGKMTRARVTAVNDTQLNVQLADGVRGRIEVSQAFDSWDDIQDKKHPLGQFTVGQEIGVRVLGTHDSKTHRFLPISHFGKACVYELSAKSPDANGVYSDLTSVADVRVGSKQLCFVNNVTDTGLWVNLAPTVRGRILRIEVSEDIPTIANLDEKYPVGSAIQAVVTNINSEGDRLELSARQDGNAAPTAVSELSIGSILPALVTKVSQESVMVQLSESLSAPIHLLDLADDFSKALTSVYEKGQIILVCIRSIDEMKNAIRLSTRPSKVLNSSSDVADREILGLNDLKVNDIVRGFVKSIAHNGVFVALTPNLNALVKVADISDSYLKDWAAGFEPGQLVKGKIIRVEPGLQRVAMSLKESVLRKHFKPLKTYGDVHVGDVVSGKIRKVEDFGVFVVIDHSANVSGLCHRTEITDEKLGRIYDLYDEGDSVRAVVLKVDLQQRRISLSMKPSRLTAADSTHVLQVSDDESDEEAGGVALADDSESDIGMESPQQATNKLPHDSEDLDVDVVAGESRSSGGLAAGGFSWTLPTVNVSNERDPFDSDSEAETSKKPKRKKAEPVIDRTGDLDTEGPRSSADFERLLLGQANASVLWLQYMAFELQQGELDRAREIAERAVRSINHQSVETEQEALNAWVGYLNLENAYGDENSLNAVFERACDVNDPQTIHSKLASVYIQSGKVDKADELLQKMVKKYSQDASVWENYAAFLFDVRAAPDRARKLLPRAMQSLPPHDHIDITRDFARLEFRSKTGQPERGRTIFEGMISNFPKRLDLWSMLLDLEMKVSEKEEIRRLFERLTSLKMKPRSAQKFFNRWLAFEEKSGDAKAREKVRAKAEDYVKRQKSAA